MLAADLSVLPSAQRTVWPRLTMIPEDFVLYGGTATALRLGHRQSLDFDFLSRKDFDPLSLKDALRALGSIKILQTARNTLSIILDSGRDVKLSFFGGIKGRVAEPEFTDNQIAVASRLDLLAHKLKTILHLSEGRDYQGVVALLRAHVPLECALGAANALFTPDFPVAESVKALTYFGDVAESWRVSADDRALLVNAVQELPAAIPPVPLVSHSLR
jgi:hypothetical protein